MFCREICMTPNDLRRTSVLALLAVSALAQAQYKILAPDGSVTYTDRPAAATAGTAKVQSMRADAPAASDALPFELRQPVSRFPVTLYTAPGCSSCDQARAYLRQRGIPFSEKTIGNQNDIRAMEQLELGGEVPLVRIGREVRRGFTQDVWATDLTLAGYPTASRLPSGYNGWDVGPLAGTPTVPKPAATPSTETPAALPPGLEAAPNGIRF
jgi:glutaredoxin